MVDNNDQPTQTPPTATPATQLFSDEQLASLQTIITASIAEERNSAGRQGRKRTGSAPGTGSTPGPAGLRPTPGPTTPNPSTTADPSGAAPGETADPPVQAEAGQGDPTEGPGEENQE